jgi:hypothetical protein
MAAPKGTDVAVIAQHEQRRMMHSSTQTPRGGPKGRLFIVASRMHSLNRDQYMKWLKAVMAIAGTMNLGADRIALGGHHGQEV